MNPVDAPWLASALYNGTVVATAGLVVPALGPKFSGGEGLYETMRVRNGRVQQQIRGCLMSSRHVKTIYVSHSYSIDGGNVESSSIAWVRSATALSKRVACEAITPRIR